MDTPKNTNANNNSQWTSIGSVVREILRDCSSRLCDPRRVG